MSSIVIQERDGNVRVLSDTPFPYEELLKRTIIEVPALLSLDTVSEEPISHLPIGDEWPAGTGSADIVLLGSDAVVTVVETKLKHNPEARREVIAQLLEYAAFVSEWTVPQIAERAEKFLHSEGCPEQYRGKSFDEATGEWLENVGWDGDLDSFCQQVEHNLRNGRLRLIVAVDEVGEHAQKIVTFINSYSAFDIYLLQISSFGESDGGRILVPTLHGYARKTATRTAPSARDWTWQDYESELRWSAEELTTARKLIERLKKVAERWEPEVRLHAGWVGLRCLGRELFGFQVFKRLGLQLWFWLRDDIDGFLPASVKRRNTQDYVYLLGDLTSLTDDQLLSLCEASVRRRERERPESVPQ